MRFVIFKTSQSSTGSGFESNELIGSNIPKFETTVLDFIKSS